MKDSLKNNRKNQNNSQKSEQKVNQDFLIQKTNQKSRIPNSV